MKLIYRNIFTSAAFVDCQFCKNFLIKADDLKKCACKQYHSENVFDPFSFNWISIDKIISSNLPCDGYNSILNWKKL